MKKLILFAFLFWSAFTVYGQLVLSSGSHMVISSSSAVVANDVTNSGGIIDNSGDLYIKGNLTNNTSDLMESSSSGTVIFNGSSAQEITGDHDANFYGTVDIDNSNGVALTATSTGSDQTINGQLNFVNGVLTLNSFNLTLVGTDPSGIGSSKYVKTNGTGGVVRSVPADGSSLVIFPVGNSTYNPVVLQNSASGTTDSYNVRVVDQKPSGSATTHMVDRSWIVNENDVGGSELTVTLRWNLGDELSAFDRSYSAVGLTTDGGTTYNWKTYAAATGTYIRTGSTYYGVGTFAVADKDYVSDNTIVESITLTDPDDECYNAVEVLTVAEDEAVTIGSNATAKFIAGEKVLLKPGFHAASGSDVHAYISSDYCTAPPPTAAPTVNEDTENTKDDLASVDDFGSGFNEMEKLVNVYPNPTTGDLTIDFLGIKTTATIRVVNFQGSVILETQTNQELAKKLDLRFLPIGVYVLVINTEGEQITKKIIKNF